MSFDSVKLTIDDGELVFSFLNGEILFTLNSVSHADFTLVIQGKHHLLVLVLVYCGQSLVTEVLLGVGILLELEDELCYFLSAAAALALCVFGLYAEFVKLALQLGDLAILVLDLVFFHGEQTLHALVFVFKSDDCGATFFVVVEHLAKYLLCFI